MTTLSSIPVNHLALECACGYVGLVPVKSFLDRYGPDALVADVTKKARCSVCRCKLIQRTQIIYIGNSELASLGSEVPPHSKP